MEKNYEERIVDPNIHNGDEEKDLSLRPQTLDDYVGQKEAKEMLSVYIQAAKIGNDLKPHFAFWQLGYRHLASLLLPFDQHNHLMFVV